MGRVVGRVLLLLFVVWCGACKVMLDLLPQRLDLVREGMMMARQARMKQ